MTISTAKAAALLRSQRHSFSNHLQVISGWLQLGHSDRALAQIQRLAARLEAEGQVVRQFDSPKIALFVAAVGLRAESYDVTVAWEVAGPVDLEGLEAADRQVTAALERLAPLPAEQRRLLVRLQTPVTVHSPAAEGEG